MEKSEILRWGIIIGIPLFILLFYKFILRVFFGLVIVPEDRIGLVTKKFVLFGKQQLPEGRIIATEGEAGFQAQTSTGCLFLEMDMAILKSTFSFLLLYQQAR